jgi:uncharacterized protein YdaU (DUF1376 family)
VGHKAYMSQNENLLGALSAQVQTLQAQVNTLLETDSASLIHAISTEVDVFYDNISKRAHNKRVSRNMKLHKQDESNWQNS